MRKLLSCSMVMAVLSVVGPQPTAAQNGGGLSLSRSQLKVVATGDG